MQALYDPEPDKCMCDVDSAVVCCAFVASWFVHRAVEISTIVYGWDVTAAGAALLTPVPIRVLGPGVLSYGFDFRTALCLNTFKASVSLPPACTWTAACSSALHDLK